MGEKYESETITFTNTSIILNVTITYKLALKQEAVVPPMHRCCKISVVDTRTNFVVQMVVVA